MFLIYVLFLNLKIKNDSYFCISFKLTLFKKKNSYFAKMSSSSVQKAPLEEMVKAMTDELIEQCKQLKAERDLYRSLLQKAEENAASEKKRLEAQIIELHRQNYALVDVNERLANLLHEESEEELVELP